jgi:uncharacterized protein (DUF697 family)
VHDVDPTRLEAGGHGLVESACGRGASGEWREAELASELLELSSEQQLDRFICALIGRAAPEAVGITHPAAGAALGTILKRTATQVLPLAGKPFGASVSPGAGRSAGTHLADRAGAQLGLELEGLSAPDREFAVAHQFVRLASAAARELALSGQGSSPGAAVRTAVARAAASHQIPELGGSAMYRTETRQGEYGWRQRRGRRWRDSQGEAYHGGYGAAEGEFPFPPFPPVNGGGYGRHHWRRHRWGDFEGEGHPGGNGAGEQQFLPLLPLIGSVLGGLLKEAEDEVSAEYAEYGPGEAEYGEGEYGEGEYGTGEAEYGEGEYGPGEAEYGEAEYAPGEAEYGETGYGPGEAEYGEAEGGEAEYGEAEEFLGRIFKTILGGEAEQPASVLNPAHEDELASRLMEVSSEDELENFLGNVVNLVGRAIHGIRDFASSPAGQAVVQAVKPLAKSVLPAAGAAIGSAVAPGIGTTVGRALGNAASSMFEIEIEVGGMSGEQAEYELAHRVVQLTSAAARSAALAPPGAPPEAVGEVAVLHEARRFAPGFYGRALHRFRPYARRSGGFGRSWGGYRRGGWYGGRPWGRYRGWYGRPYGGYAPPADSGPAPDAGPPPEEPPAPPRPGFRWVAVPVDAPTPGPSGPEPGGPPGPGGPAGPGGPGGPPPPAQGEMGGWRQRGGRGRGYGA